MTRETEERLEEIMDELSQLRNQEEICAGHEGMLGAAEHVVAKVLSQKQNARYINQWQEREGKI